MAAKTESAQGLDRRSVRRRAKASSKAEKNELEAKRAENGAKHAQNKISDRSEGNRLVRLVRINLVLSAACVVVATGLAVYATTKPVNTAYIAATEDNRLIELTPLAHPNLSDEAVASWVVRAVEDTFNFSFNDMDRSLSRSFQEYYSTGGSRAFMREFQASGFERRVRESSLIVDAAVTDKPIVIRSEFDPRINRYRWMVPVEAILTLRTSTSRTPVTNRVRFTVVVTRAHDVRSESGIEISNIAMRVVQGSRR